MPDHFALELIRSARPEDRCPYLDAEGRCLVLLNSCRGSLYHGEQDHASLQLWCLAGRERWPACALWPG